jgi:hypothetical protein
MISKSLHEADKKYFMKNTKAKMLLQKLNQNGGFIGIIVFKEKSI